MAKERNTSSILKTALFLSILIVAFVCWKCHSQPPADALNSSDEADAEREMPKIMDIIMEEEFCVALCEDGSVWQWENAVGKEPQEIEELKNIVSIMEGGRDASTLYALSEDGCVYAWGSNSELLVDAVRDYTEEFESPIRFGGLEDIVAMDVRNGYGFAVDGSGRFYAWGIILSNGNDCIPGFPAEQESLVEGVAGIFAGAGSYHYFVREDGSIFSIMESNPWLHQGNIRPFIFPVFGGERERPDAPAQSAWTIEGSVRIDSAGMGCTFLYEMGSWGNIRLIGSDEYTVFVYVNVKKPL